MTSDSEDNNDSVDVIDKYSYRDRVREELDRGVIIP